MIFASFDRADISVLRNVRKKFFNLKNNLMKKETIDTSQESVLIRNITDNYCSTALNQKITFDVIFKNNIRLCLKLTIFQILQCHSSAQKVSKYLC